MKRLSKRTASLLVAAALMVAAGGTAALAQGTAAAPAVDLTAGRDVNLTLEQMQAETRAMPPRFKKEAEGVKQALEQSRKKKDVVKSLCLTDKLKQMEIVHGIAGDRIAAVDEAAAAHNLDRARSEYRIAAVLSDRSKELVSEANQCIGEEATIFGESEVVVDIDPNIPDDPSDFPEVPVVLDPPVLSSPTR